MMLEKIISEVATYLVVAVVGVVGSFVAKAVNRQANKIEDERIRLAARAAVKWAFSRLAVPGHKKFEIILARLKTRYPKVDTEQLEEAVEAAYLDFKENLDDLDRDILP